MSDTTFITPSSFVTGDPLCSPRTDGSDLWDFQSRVGFRDRSGHVWWTDLPFVSDGASIPFFLQPLLGHSFASDYIRPAALHDWYYRNWAARFGSGNRLADSARLTVDKMFFEALMADGIHPVRAWLLYRGVRLGGWHAWNRHARAADAQRTALSIET